MNCNEVSGLLEKYIMDELDECDRKAVDKHLHECGSCYTEYKELKQVILSVRNLKNTLNIKEDVLLMSKKNTMRNLNKKKTHRRSVFPVAVACISVVVCILTSSFLVFPSFAYKLVPELPVIKEMEQIRDKSEEILQQNEAIMQEYETIKQENQEIKEQMESVILENEQLKMQLKEIGGEEITEIITSEGVPESDNIAIQSLVIDFIKAMYKGDLNTVKTLGTDGFNTQLDRMKDHILMDGEGLVIFRQITNAAFHDGKYLVFVRVNDTSSEGEADYQWNFELLKTDSGFLVDYVGMDA